MAIPIWKHQLPRKNTEVKQQGPRIALKWMTIQGLDVDAVASNRISDKETKVTQIYKIFYLHF